VVREYETLADMTVSTWFERTRTPGWGLFGGRSGAVTAVEITEDGTARSLLKCNQLAVRRGTRIVVATGGGGGYGPPEERDPAAVREDMADGYVTTWPIHDAERQVRR
jgi:N-methylhydantoinase B